MSLRSPSPFAPFLIALGVATLQACGSAPSAEDDAAVAEAIAADEMDDGTSALARAGDDGIEETAAVAPDAAPLRSNAEDEPDDLAGDDPTAPSDPAPLADATAYDGERAAIDLGLQTLQPLATPGRAKHPKVGMSNSRPQALTRDPGVWRGLHVSRLRVFVPWDVALRGDGDPRRAEFEAALQAAGPANVEPFVMFSPCSPRDADNAAAHFDAQRNPARVFCRATPATAARPAVQWAPTAREYDVAFKAFVREYVLGSARARANQWPKIRFIGAWNEPNFGSADGDDIRTPSGTPLYAKSCGRRRGDACGATLAAHYYKIAEGRCLQSAGSLVRRQCRVIAGEFTSDPSAGAYWDTYLAGLRGVRSQPQIWSIHPTHDVQRLEFHGVGCVQPGCTTKTFAGWVDRNAPHAQIWLTETAADYRDPKDMRQTAEDRDALTNANGARTRREERQDRGMRFALYTLPAISPKISRIYLYDFQQDCTLENGKGGRFDDPGLLAPECQGSPGHDRVRPSYRTVANRYVRP